MDLQLFLALSAASYSAVVIAQMVIMQVHRLPGSAKGFAMHAWVIVVTLIGFLLFPSIYGYVAALALALTILPGFLLTVANRRLLANRVKDAALYARLAALLHPTAGMRFGARHYAALAESTPERKIAALTALQARATPDQAAIIQVQILRQRNDWAGLADFFRQGAIRATPELINHAIRALGETAQLDAMVQAYAGHAAILSGAALHLACLMVLAFSGRVEATRLQLSAFGTMAPETKAFWQATALQAAGRGDEARRLLDGVDRASLDDAQRDMVARRLDAPAAEAAWLLSPQARAQVDALQRQAGRDLPPVRADWRQTPVTYVLILANCLMFAVEMLHGGSEDLQNLFDLGGLWPEAVLRDHEWWRLGTAMFLHAGPEHLVSNMFALWILGRFVEVGIGSIRTALIYGVGGLASMAGVLWLTQMGYIEANLLVGASGAIFALLGAITLRRFADFLASRAVADRRNLTLILTVLGIQAAIALAVPQISFTAHGIGLAAGILLGWVLTPRTRA